MWKKTKKKSKRSNMKAIGAAVLAVAVSGFAQAPKPTPPPPPAGVHTPNPAQTPPMPPPQATPVEPKHSEATANLRAAEAEKSEFMTQQKAIVQAAQTQLSILRAQIDAKDKEEATYEDQIRKENGWDSEVQYVPAQEMQDGTKIPGKWQKTVKK
jgi:hypothetical protein